MLPTGSQKYSKWSYVNTLSNPADVASRGLKADVFLRSKTWLSGPAYLLHPEQNWPVSPDCLGELLPNDPGVKVSVAVNAVQISKDVDSTTRLIPHLSPWTHQILPEEKCFLVNSPVYRVVEV